MPRLSLSRKRPVDPTELAGSVALVTGAASGIGRSIARLVGSLGAEVHVCDISVDGVEAVAAEISAAGGRATSHVLDVSDATALESLAASLFAGGGGVDLLFNNAGVGHAGKVADTPLEDWRRLVEINLMGVVHGVHAFLPKMLERGVAATIVNTASGAGLLPNPGMVPYSTTKAAVVGLSVALDTEVRGRGVRVVALCPGIIDTAIVRTSTMRGSWAKSQDAAVKFYAKRGTSPDVVARDALAAVRSGKVIVPTPRWQVLPMWLGNRWVPGLTRRISNASMKVIGPRK
jgi:NAD(P)-dependent dehydrogenase (short-subunit alcohol dehydrogenase family)